MDVHDKRLSPALRRRLALALDWVPMYHVRRTDRDRAAHPLDSYWYYPLAAAEDRDHGDATMALAALDDALQPVKEAWRAVREAAGQSVRLYECEYTANPFGSEGHPHHDCPAARARARHITAIVYCNLEWRLEWAGETIAFDKQGDVMAAVLPKPGRIALIRGDPLHVARPVARLCPVPRRVLVYKMWAA